MSIELIDKLKSQEFINFLSIRLKEAMEHPFVSQQRILLPCDDFDYYDLDENDYEILKKNKRRSNVLIGYEYINNEMCPIYKKINYGMATPYRYYRSDKINEFEKRVGSSPYLFHDGIIAGGAIAALANEFLFGIPAIINDIDYFYFSNFKFADHREAYNEIYENLCEKESGFFIKKSINEGIVNLIKIELPDDKNIWSKLMSYFDLNCCMIGFHPTTKKLIINEEFKEFINTRKINHIDDDLNFSNLVRAKRKSVELNCKYYYGDAVRTLILKDLNASSFSDEWEMTSFLMEKRSIPLISQNKRSARKRSARFISGKDILELEKNRNLLEPYFEFNTLNKSLKYVGSIPLVKFYQDYVFKKGSWKKYKRSQETNWFIISNLMKEINPAYPKEEISHKYYERLLNLIQGLAILDIKLAGDELQFDRFKLYMPFLNQEIDKNKFCSLINKLEGHENCVVIFFYLLQLKWHFNDIDLFFKRIKNKPKEYYGILKDIFKEFSTNQYSSLIKIGKKEVYIQFNKGSEYILEKMDEINRLILESTNVILRNKVNLRLFEQYASELVSGMELAIEGQKMSHCVGGRFTSVSKQDCRIFHLKYNGTETTLELIYKQKLWTIGEHKGFGNKFPGSQMQNFAKIFCNYINLYNL
jgi:hypothetical protein